MAVEEQAGHPGAAHEAAAHGGGYDAGEAILHHITDAQTLELPLVGEVHLPTLHLGSYDLPITRHVVMMWVASLVVLLLCWGAARRRRMVPGRVQSLVEVAVIRDVLGRRNIGPHGDRHVPYLLTTFVFILACNLLGLLPWGATATANISLTAGLALVAFLTVQGAGIREYGLVGHCKNLI